MSELRNKSVSFRANRLLTAWRLYASSAEFAGMNGVLAPNAGTFAGGRNGNEIPYIPEWKLATGIGLTTVTGSADTDSAAVGLGEDLRLESADAFGAALDVDGRLVHLTAFAGKVEENLSRRGRMPSGWRGRQH